MKTLLIILGIVLASVALGQDQPAKANSDYAREWVARVNEIRMQGCKCGKKVMAPTETVKWSEEVAEVAYLYAQTMSATGHFAHTEPDGTDFGDRLERHGINYMSAGENIGLGQESIEEMFNDWLNSPGHCQNMMNNYSSKLGVGSYNGYWVMVLLKEADNTETTPIVASIQTKSHRSNNEPFDWKSNSHTRNYYETKSNYKTIVLVGGCRKRPIKKQWFSKSNRMVRNLNEIKNKNKNKRISVRCRTQPMWWQKFSILRRSCKPMPNAGLRQRT